MELQKQMQWEIPENHQIIGPEITNEQEVREMLLQRGFSSSQVGMILNISLEVERQLQAGTQETLLLANSGKLELSEEAIARKHSYFYLIQENYNETIYEEPFDWVFDFGAGFGNIGGWILFWFPSEHRRSDRFEKSIEPFGID